MTDEKIQSIVLNLFPDLTEMELKKELAEVAVIRTYQPGTIIMHEHETVQHLPFLLSGTVRITREDDDGRDILLYYITAGESCIASFSAVVFNEESRIKAVAEEVVEVLMIPATYVNKWNLLYRSWNNFIIKMYNKRFEQLLEVINSVSFQKVDERLKALLKRKAEVFKTKNLTVTHQQLADELGTAREVVSRLLKTLENDGLLELSRGMIKVSDKL
jgi:CRP/FNR family transcriptional regulator, anaerobic regulatory protein